MDNAIMLSRYGEVYPAIDHKYHPNAGLREEDYPEIERVVDWMYLHKLSMVKSSLDEWVKIRVAQYLYDVDNASRFTFDKVVSEVFYSDIYEPCDSSKNSVKEYLLYFVDNPREVNEYAFKNEKEVSDNIVNFLNEKFLRVRLGGKFDSKGEEAIYFRISSHGYDWKRVIVNFLWDEFGSIEKMPKRIWVGHDKETNPPETVLYDGSPKDLVEGTDYTLFESINKMKLRTINLDKRSQILNNYFNEKSSSHLSLS